MEIKEERRHPWLLIPQKHKQFFYSVFDNRFYTANIPELRNKCVYASAFGWLVLVDVNTNDCYLWHPVSLAKIELPHLTLSPYRCFLSKPPTEPDCHILFISSDSVSLIFLRIGDQFVTQTSPDNDKMRLFSLARFQGKTYGIACHNSDDLFVTVDFVGGTLEINPILMESGQFWNLPQPSRAWSELRSDYFIESSFGELLFVSKMIRCNFQEGFDFNVFRLDVDRMEVNKIVNIGEQAIFISEYNDAFCCSSSGIKPNCIYYTVPGSRNLFMYDLGDRSTTMSLSCSIAKRPEFRSSWISPQIFPNFLN